VLTGLTGNDTLNGGAGNDSMDGGAAGSDTASYADAASAVTVSLAHQGAAQNTIGAGVDTLSNFENLTGSAFNDTLTGDGNANFLSGLAGNDVLLGAAGNDALAGAAGNDSLNGAGDDPWTAGRPAAIRPAMPMPPLPSPSASLTKVPLRTPLAPDRIPSPISRT
jgi:Ca2+-binding RTX toxin-like protein